MTPKNPRTRDLAQIHVAIKQLGMSQEDHRTLLASVCGVSSAAELDDRSRRRYLDHLRKLGFKPRLAPSTQGHQQPRGARKAAPSRALAQDAESRKIRALWLLLHELGAVRDASEAALCTYVKRIARVEALQWLNARQSETVIETLKKWAMRYLPEQVQDMAQRLSRALGAAAIQLPAQEQEALRYVVAQAQERQTFDPMLDAYQALRVTWDNGGKP